MDRRVLGLWSFLKQTEPAQRPCQHSLWILWLLTSQLLGMGCGHMFPSRSGVTLNADSRHDVLASGPLEDFAGGFMSGVTSHSGVAHAHPLHLTVPSKEGTRSPALVPLKRLPQYSMCRWESCGEAEVSGTADSMLWFSCGLPGPRRPRVWFHVTLSSRL